MTYSAPTLTDHGSVIARTLTAASGVSAENSLVFNATATGSGDHDQVVSGITMTGPTFELTDTAGETS